MAIVDKKDAKKKAAAEKKAAAGAKACKLTVAKGAAGAYAPQPSDGCVLDT